MMKTIYRVYRDHQTLLDGTQAILSQRMLRCGYLMVFVSAVLNGMMIDSAAAQVRPTATGEVAELVGDPELFDLVTMAYLANKQRILTWRGRVVVDTHDMIKSQADVRAKNTVIFVYDQKQGAYRWSWHVEDWIDTRGDVEGISSGGTSSLFNTGIVKDGALYRLSYGHQPEEFSHQAGIYPLNKVKRGPMVNVSFDPMYWLTYAGKRENAFQTLARAAKKGKRLRGIVVSREGNLVVVTVGGGTNTVNRYTADLSKGGNLVAYYGKDPKVSEDWEYQYEEVKGIWVPKEVRYENKSVRKGETETSIAHLRWAENVLNEPVTADEFSLVKLGLRKRDTVYDTRSRTTSTIKGKEFPSPPLPEGKGGPEPSTSRRRFVVIALSAIGLLLALVAIMIRRQQRRT